MSKKPDPQKAPDLSDAKEWEKLHKAMTGDDSALGKALSKGTAYADKYLVTDEELPLYRHLQLFTIFAIIIAFIIWASFATLEQVARGDGKVIPSSEIQIIQHQEGGIVDELLVRSGDRVSINQVLIRLRDVGATSELGSSEARHNGLRARIIRLQAEAEGYKEAPTFPQDLIDAAPQSVQEELNTYRANKMKLDSEISVLRQQVNQREQEVREINIKISDTNRVLSLTQDELNLIKPLVDRGTAPRLELLQLDRQIAQQRTELNGLRAALPRANASVLEARARLDDLTTQARATAQADLAQTQIEMQSIGRTLGALEDRRDRTELRSPVDGIVKDLKINTIGGVVKPGDDVIEIVPADDQLLIEARIRPADIAFIYPGQRAMVKFTAYDFAIYGGLAGEVADISADTITNEKGESFYRVKIRTDQATLRHKGQDLPIIPGMVTTVDILTGERTVMQYLMKPFIKTLDSALKER